MLAGAVLEKWHRVGSDLALEIPPSGDSELKSAGGLRGVGVGFIAYVFGCLLLQDGHFGFSQQHPDSELGWVGLVLGAPSYRALVWGFLVALGRVSIWLLARNKKEKAGRKCEILQEEPLSPTPRTPFVGEKVALMGRQLSLPFYYLIRNLLKSRDEEKGRVEMANQRAQCWEVLRRELARAS